jgi:hypothetical protein
MNERTHNRRTTTTKKNNVRQFYYYSNQQVLCGKAVSEAKAFLQFQLPKAIN